MASGWLCALYRPLGNLLGPDIQAEVTVHVLEHDFKSVISKIEDQPGFALRQRVIQALLFSAINVAKERAIDIRWDALAQLYPPHPPAPGPPR